MKRTSVFVCAALIALVAVGCGGGDDDSGSTTRDVDTQSISDQTGALLKAFKASDAKAFCELLEPNAMRVTYKTARACADHYAPLVKQAGKSEEFDRIELGNVDFRDDDHAVAVFKDQLGAVDFEKVSGTWWVVMPDARPATSAPNG